MIVLSFYYTDKVVTIIKEKDPIMIKLNEYKEILDVKPVNAEVSSKIITPGINGCKVNVNSSYSKMTQIGEFNTSMIDYIEVQPKLSLKNIYGKYIEKGKTNNYIVSIIIKLNNVNHINNILKTLNDYKVYASFFVDGIMIEENMTDIYKIVKAGNEIYNLGYSGNYDEEYIEWTNTMINNLSNNHSKLCLTTKMDEDILELCSKHKMHTLKPTLVINNGISVASILSQIEKGSIVVFEANEKTESDLANLITFLSKKGYEFQTLSKHLSEKGC